MDRLTVPAYLAFPLRVGPDGGELCDRARHVRDQIEQVLFTAPGERVFRGEFGAGIRRLIFEPNTSALWDLTRQRLTSALADALQGEVDPRSLRIDVEGDSEQVRVVISYVLAALGHSERHTVLVGAGGTGRG